MPPPQLARDAPVVDVVHPVEIDLPVIFGRNRDLASFDRLTGALGKGSNLDEPLRRQSGLDHGAAAIALGEGKRVVLHPHQKSLFFEVVDDSLSSFPAIESGIYASVLVQAGALVEEINLRQLVAQSRLKIISVMGGRNLDRPGTELGLSQDIGDNRDLPIHQGQQHTPALEMAIALVLRVHGNCGIAQHGLRPGGRYRDRFLASHHRIADLIEFAGRLLVLDLKVRNSGFAARAPIDDVFAAVN